MAIISRAKTLIIFPLILFLAFCLIGCSDEQGNTASQTEAYEYRGIKIEVPKGYESSEGGDATRIAKDGVEGGMMLLSLDYPSEAMELDLSKVLNVQEATKQISSEFEIGEEPLLSVVQEHPVCSYNHIEKNDFYYDIRGFGFDDHVVILVVSYKDTSDEALKSVADSYTFTEKASAGLTSASEDIASGKTPHRDYSGKYDPEIGMSTSDILASSWGEPEKKNVTESANKRQEQWVYSNNRYIYFEDGIVTSIQKSE